MIRIFHLLFVFCIIALLKSVNSQKPSHSSEYNFASSDVGAKIIAASSGSVSPSRILNEDHDKYMLIPKSNAMKSFFFVVELSEVISMKRLAVANFEFYSCSIKTFKLYGRVKENEVWESLGIYEAENSKSVQTFELDDPKLVRYIMVNVTSIYQESDSFYCTLSLLRVHGETLYQDLVTLMHVEVGDNVDPHQIDSNLIETLDAHNSQKSNKGSQIDGEEELIAKVRDIAQVDSPITIPDFESNPQVMDYHKESIVDPELLEKLVDRTLIDKISTNNDDDDLLDFEEDTTTPNLISDNEGEGDAPRKGSENDSKLIVDGEKPTEPNVPIKETASEDETKNTTLPSKEDSNSNADSAHTKDGELPIQGEVEENTTIAGSATGTFNTSTVDSTESISNEANTTTEPSHSSQSQNTTLKQEDSSTTSQDSPTPLSQEPQNVIVNINKEDISTTEKEETIEKEAQAIQTESTLPTNITDNSANINLKIKGENETTSNNITTIKENKVDETLSNHTNTAIISNSSNDTELGTESSPSSETKPGEATSDDSESRPKKPLESGLKQDSLNIAGPESHVKNEGSDSEIPKRPIEYQSSQDQKNGDSSTENTPPATKSESSIIRKPLSKIVKGGRENILRSMLNTIQAVELENSSFSKQLKKLRDQYKEAFQKVTTVLAQKNDEINVLAESILALRRKNRKYRFECKELLEKTFQDMIQVSQQKVEQRFTQELATFKAQIKEEYETKLLQIRYYSLVGVLFALLINIYVVGFCMGNPTPSMSKKQYNLEKEVQQGLNLKARALSFLKHKRSRSEAYALDNLDSDQEAGEN